MRSVSELLKENEALRAENSSLHDRISRIISATQIMADEMERLRTNQPPESCPYRQQNCGVCWQ